MMDATIDRIAKEFSKLRPKIPLQEIADIEEFLTAIFDAKLLFDAAVFAYNPPSKDKDDLHELIEALEKVESLFNQGDDKTSLPGDVNFCRMLSADPDFPSFLDDVRKYRAIASKVHVAKGKPGKKPNLTELDAEAIRGLAEYWDGLPGQKYTNEWDGKNPLAPGSCFLFVVTKELAPHVTPHLPTFLQTFKI